MNKFINEIKETDFKQNFKIDAELIGSVFALIGALFLSMNEPVGFFAFLVSNLAFIKMAMVNNLKAFFLVQIAFTTTSLMGIFNNFDVLAVF
jgi:nicotinamide riboside transporter PnuC